jgi:hypothetical protein
VLIGPTCLGASPMNARMRIDIGECQSEHADQFPKTDAVSARFIFNDISDQITKLQKIYSLSLEKSELIDSFNVEDWLTKTVRIRRLRENYFPSDLFADPAWEILLDLTIAKRKGIKISVSSLCIAASVPTTTALRKINHMIVDGLIFKEPDKNDRRRTYISICDQAYLKMLDYISESYKISSSRSADQINRAALSNPN